MGNIFKHDDDQNSIEDFDIGSKQYKPSEFHLLNEKLQIMEKACRFNFKLDEDNKINEDIKNNFLKKYGKYIDINRFAIPIIGAINSGKSTFLNNFLNLNNILQMGEKVTTRFITIIRHDKNTEIPELYHVQVERRGITNNFNFKEKGECVLKSNNYKDFANEIQKLNEDIEVSRQQNSDKYLYDIEKYFLIIRTKIPLFEGELEEYGNLIDFLDIPGLDEVYYNNFDDFVKLIFPNIIFPLFIFDVFQFENDSSFDVIKKYFNSYTENIRAIKMKNGYIEYNKGIFLLNKAEEINEKETKLEVILENFKKKYQNLDLDNGKKIFLQLEQDYNCFFISAKKINLNKSGNFIDDILIDIQSQAKHSEENSFKFFFKNYLLSKYNIDLKDAKEEIEDYTLKEKLDIINAKLKKICSSLNNPKLTLKELTFLNKYSKKKANEDEEKFNQKMTFQIQNNIKEQLDDYLYFNLEGLMPKIDLNVLEEKKSLIKKEKNKKVNLKKMVDKVDSLFPPEIVKKYNNISNLIQLIKNFNAFYDNRNIRLLFIGMISSGKTSLLNSIIGNNYNILQTTLLECTKCIYRIRYSKKIYLCETQLIKNKIMEENDGNYFEDIKGTEIYDLEQIKNKIQILNNESKFKYYTLYIPIQGLEDFEYKERIELIDLPGIRREVNDIKIDLKLLITMCDGFIFNFNSLNIDDENSQYIFTEIINDIKNKKINEPFNFDNCLFNLNFIDQIEEDSIDKNVSEFQKSIIKNLNNRIYTGNFIEKLAIKSQILSTNNINVSFISNLYYNQYWVNVDKILSLKFITNDNLEDIYENLLEEYDEEEIEKLISENGDLINKKLEEKISLIKQKTSDKNNDEYIDKICKFLVIFEKFSTKLIKKYEASKAEIFFQKFKNQINFSYTNNKNNINDKLNGVLITLLFKLYYYNELCLNEKKLDFDKKNIEVKKNLIEKEFKRIEGVIEEKYSSKIKIIEEVYKNQAIETLKKERYYNANEIRERLIQLGYQDKLSKLFNSFYNNELKNISLDFIYFCINEISDLLSSESLQNIISIITDNFREKNDSSDYKAGLIFGALFAASSIGVGAASVGGVVFILCTYGAIYTGIPLIVFGVIKFKEWLQDTNENKVKEYFDRVIKELKKNKKEFIEKIKIKKEEFIEKLQKTNEITSDEIKNLNKANYPSNFQNFIQEFK